MPKRPDWLGPTVVATAVLAVFAGMAQFGVTAVFGDVAEAFGEAGTSDAAGQVGLSATTVGIGLAVIRLAGAGSLIGASLADRAGRRRVLLGVTTLGLLLTLAATAMPGYWLFVAVIALARPLLSTTNALTVVVAAEETGAGGRAWAIAFVGAAYALGSGAISVLRGVVEGADHRVILALAAAPVVLIPLVARRVEEPPRARDLSHPAVPVRLGSVPSQWRGRVALMAGLAAGIALVTGPAFTYLFVYGENVLGFSSGRMALLVLAAGPTGLVGLLVGRAAADRLGRRVTAAVATALVALAAALAYSGSSAVFAAGYLATITASGAFGPAKGALVNEVVPTAHRATTNGWVAAAGVIGAVAGLGLFGALADLMGGYPAASRVLFLPVLPAVLLYSRLPETRGLELDSEAVTSPE